MKPLFFTSKLDRAICLLALCVLTLAGCSSLPTTNTAASCPAINTANVEQAFNEASATLAKPNCAIMFEDYFQQLLAIAAESPDAANKQRFDRLFKQMDHQGVISRNQAMERYTQYFSSSFMALSDTYNVCSSAREEERILAALKSELQLKKKGLMDVLGDKEVYFQAQKRQQEISLILQTTVLACAAQNG